MENFLLSLDRKKQIKMLEDALKEDRFDIFMIFRALLWRFMAVWVLTPSSLATLAQGVFFRFPLKYLILKIFSTLESLT